MKMLRSLFDVYWRQLAAEGKVGAIDSADYDRVLGEWRVKGYPDVTTDWMMERATPREIGTLGNVTPGAIVVDPKGEPAINRAIDRLDYPGRRL